MSRKHFRWAVPAAVVKAYPYHFDYRLDLGRDQDRFRLTVDHPVIAQVFHPETGWRRFGMRKRISYSYARTLRAQGYTAVALSFAGRLADFTLAELVRRR